MPDREISRHLALAAVTVSAADVLEGGDADERLTVAQVARLLGVTPRYVRRLCEAGRAPGWRRPGGPGIAAVSAGRGRSVGSVHDSAG